MELKDQTLKAEKAPVVEEDATAYHPAQVCIHGHFYQPPRENPFTGQVPHELGAEPYANFNEKINAECYRPNALAGNFERISFNLGPTLATWIEQNDPQTHARIVASDRLNYERYGFGNALAQNYNHVILPLAKPEDARMQIEWGIMDFERRFGHRPEGMWLAESGASTWVLDLMAQAGIKFVILAPWQANAATVETINPAQRAIVQSRLRQQIIDKWRAESLQHLDRLREAGADPAEIAGLVQQISTSLPHMPERVPEPYNVSEPYLVELFEGRSIVAFFYNGKLSGDVSFNQYATSDANRFAYDWLLPELDREKLDRNEAQLLLVATDGELYGHHQSYRDLFLKHLTEVAVGSTGMALTFPSRYLRENPPHRRIRIHDNSSWSCHHGVERWSNGCGCTPGNSGWKGSLRRACDLLADDVDRIFAAQAPHLFKNPAQALREFLYVWQGAAPDTGFLERHLKPGKASLPGKSGLALRLLRAQMYKHQMYTSCAWFFEDIDRIEPKNALAAAAIIFRLLGRLVRPGLRDEFEQILAAAISQHTGLNGKQLYQRGLRWASKRGALPQNKSAASTLAQPAEKPGTNGGQEAVA
jgi:alpha-amylase/alpha-mannosidase (GH57 family)